MSKTLVLAASDIARIVLEVGLDEMMDDLISSPDLETSAGDSLDPYQWSRDNEPASSPEGR